MTALRSVVGVRGRQGRDSGGDVLPAGIFGVMTEDGASPPARDVDGGADCEPVLRFSCQTNDFRRNHFSRKLEIQQVTGKWRRYPDLECDGGKNGW